MAHICSSLELKILHFPCRFSILSIQSNPLSLKPYFVKQQPRALRTEWHEYEDAVKRKDLASALKFLKNNQNQDEPVEISESNRLQTQLGELGINGYKESEKERDWEVLDTCLNADDMRLVAAAYGFLKDRGFLPNFGRFESVGIVYLLDKLALM